MIVGLGNPGSRYQSTRHNIGRRFVEYAAQTLSFSLKQDKKLKACFGSCVWDQRLTAWAFPATFMNESGKTVKALVDFFSLTPAEELLIVVDDAALPFGRLRMRASGSDGGHNGLKSVHEALHTSHYARLRIGIAQTSGEPLTDYVLSPFLKEEERKIPPLMQRVEEAVRLWVTGSIGRAMNAVNAYKDST